MSGTRLFPKNFKYCAAGGSLVAVPGMTKDGCSIKIDPHLLEEVHSDSPEPVNIYNLGAKIEGQAMITGADLDDLAEQLNTTNSSGITMNATIAQPEALAKKDIQFEVVLPDNATNDLETWKVTNVFWTGDLDGAFKQGEAWYLPMKFRSSSTSVLTIAQT